MLLGVELRDAKEEIFVRMVCDGLAIGVAFQTGWFHFEDQGCALQSFSICHAFKSEPARYLRHAVPQAL